MGYIFQLTSSHLQALKIQIRTYKPLLYCGILLCKRWGSHGALKVLMSGSTT